MAPPDLPRPSVESQLASRLSGDSDEKGAALLTANETEQAVGESTPLLPPQTEHTSPSSPPTSASASQPLSAQPRKPLSVIDYVALVLWIGWLHILGVLFFTVAVTFPSPLSLTIAAILVTLTILPVDINGPLAKAYCSFIVPRVTRYFPVRVAFEDEAAIQADKTYVWGLEPHSVLPLSLVGLTGNPAFRRTFCGATSAIFRVPLIKHAWQWLRLTPADKPNLTRLLRGGNSVMVIPGGVQECLYMEHGKEAIFLKKRLGFIRLACEQGAPLVPIFSFGQSDTFHFWQPSGWWHSLLSRRLGFAPMAFWGVGGSFIPYRVPITSVVGRPIDVGPADSNPDREKVAALHAEFTEAMRALFYKHRAAAGYATTELEIM
eukprot:TRINITY_DN29028_c0_g1_i1.p1 TRINITY_DN29028_c0_g1~~TRINITY_DN29028_c0_g1_i1.p1  ORF type:complete len:377 (+),score=2.63 TRINITY_DN29028_c0_g1_i1:210-1340(+)